MENNKENQKKPNEIIAEVAASGNDVYRVSRWTGKDDVVFAEIKRCFKAPETGELKETKDKFNLEAKFRLEVAAAMKKAAEAPALPEPAEGEKYRTKPIDMIPVSGERAYGVTKVRGTKYHKVHLQLFRKTEQGDIPSKKKVKILEDAVPGICEALASPKWEAATETVAA